MSCVPPSVPSSADACMTIVRSLMCYRMGGENEVFSRRAIESLVKKLKEKRDELDSLITAITTSGTHPSKCVNIQRTLDGRLQVAGRKGFPHVMYAKIWRWSDLHRSELRHIRSCQYAFDLKCDLVCVNPYHYERVVSTGINLLSLDLQSVEIDSVDLINDEYNGNSEKTYKSINEEYNIGMEENVKVRQTIQHHPIIQTTTSNNVHDPLRPRGSNHSNQTAPIIPLVVEKQQQYGIQKLQKASNSKVNYNGQSSCSSRNPESESYNKNVNVLISSLHANKNYNEPMSSTMKCEQYLQYQRAGYSSALAHNLHHPTTARQQNNTSTLNYNQRDNYNDDTRSTAKSLLSSQPAPEFWCSIAYFELDSQVGETFKVKSCYSSVTVDGYVDPSGGNRFCLGALCNVHRTERSEKTRPHIGRGVTLEVRDEGDVWLKCESEYSVFVQSHYLDVQAGRASGNTVHKIHPAAHIKVFDLHKCHSHMRGQVATAQAAAAAQAAAVEGRLAHDSSIAKGISAAAGIGVDDLRRLCILRLSFVKGWGPDYPRHTIKETPCWIEMHLFRALQLLDEVLHAMPIDGSGRNDSL